MFIEQLAHMQPVVWRIAINHRCIEALATKIHAMLHRGGQLHRYVRAQCLPLHQARQQPAHHAGWGLELQGSAASTDLTHALLNQREYLLYTRQPVLAFAGQAQPAGLALEKRITQVRFEGSDLPADGAWVMCSCCPARVKLQCWAVTRKVCRAGRGGKRFIVLSMMTGHG